jgi:LysM repeat protein
MSTQTPSALTLINAANHALKEGDRRTARRLAEQAAALDPHLEQPWLILAYLASPKAGLYYVGRALQANPESQQALAAQAWLIKQVDASAQAPLPAPVPAISQPTEPAAPAVEQPVEPPLQLPGDPADSPNEPPGLQPTGQPESQVVLSAVEQTEEPAALPIPALLADAATNAAPALATGPVTAIPSAPKKQRIPLWGLGIALLVLVVAGLAFAKGQTPPAAKQDATLAGVVQTVIKAGATKQGSATPIATGTALPSKTFTQTYTASPTGTSSPSPTVTASPVPSETPTAPPSATPTVPPTATKPPAPTAKPTQVSNISYTVARGDTLMLIAQKFNVPLQSLIAANTLANPSMIRAGQVITIPKDGAVAPSTKSTSAPATPPSASGSGKEILIDISEQHIYAYQDGKLMYSFVASTGIGNSTRIGTFKILDKIPNAYSYAFNIYMPWWMGIYYSGTLENGIHGLPLLTNGVELWASLLGKPATYGCIESKTSEMKQIYDWAEVGIPVIIRP